MLKWLLKELKIKLLKYYYMLKCENCEHEFDTPYIQIDELNDEWYELCPLCHSEDIGEMPLQDWK